MVLRGYGSEQWSMQLSGRLAARVPASALNIPASLSASVSPLRWWPNQTRGSSLFSKQHLSQLKRESGEEEVRSFWGPKPLDGKCYVIVFKTYSLSQVEGKKDGHCQRVLPLFHIEPILSLSLTSDTHHNFLLLLFWLRRRRERLHSAPDDAAALNEWNLIFGSKWEEWKGDRKLPASAVRARLYTSVMATSCCPECNGNLCT